MRTLIYDIPAEDDGRPISRLVRSRLGLSYHLFAQLKLQEAILLDGTPVRANHIAHTGQRLCVRIEEPRRHLSSAPPESIPIEILYRDEDLIVINKPAPLPCQSTQRQRTGTLENRLVHHFAAEGEFVFRPINRLDKGTSGLMAAALHPHAQMLLSEKLHTDDFVREYMALVCGQLSPPAGTVSAPIDKADGATVRREVRPDGKHAVTHYETESFDPARNLSLVKLRLETGRTHQIRVHMAHMGCPVFGDFLYGEESTALPGRFALHSHRLAFTHPLSGCAMSFCVPFPPELSAAAAGLKGAEAAPSERP